MIGRWAARLDSVLRETALFSCLSCALNPAASDAAAAEPRNPRRVIDMLFSEDEKAISIA
jgi:hypothetical protein